MPVMNIPVKTSSEYDSGYTRIVVEAFDIPQGKMLKAFSIKFKHRTRVLTDFILSYASYIKSGNNRCFLMSNYLEGATSIIGILYHWFFSKMPSYASWNYVDADLKNPILTTPGLVVGFEFVFYKENEQLDIECPEISAEVDDYDFVQNL